jgi:hypothetical protein
VEYGPVEIRSLGGLVPKSTCEDSMYIEWRIESCKPPSSYGLAWEPPRARAVEQWFHGCIHQVLDRERLSN